MVQHYTNNNFSILVSKQTTSTTTYLVDKFVLGVSGRVFGLVHLVVNEKLYPVLR